MQKSPQESVRQPLKKMPELSSQKPKEVMPKNKENILQRIDTFYRYRIASLARALKKPIYEQATSHQNKQQKMTKENRIELLDKQVLTKSKYRHRDKINFRRDPLLKLMKYDFEALRNKMKTKEFQSLYQDLDDEETQTKEEKEENKKEFEVDPRFGIESFNLYRKKNGLAANQKILAVGGYNDLINYLLSRGWHQNPDQDSLIYDFKFITKCRHIDHVNMLQHQIVNHFQKTNVITTKYGLCRNIRNLLQMNKDPDVYYPRCFDLHDSSQFQDWVEDFKFSKVIAILKAFQANHEEIHKNEFLAVLCLSLAKRYGIDIEKRMNLIEDGRFPVISQEEWKMLNSKKKQDPAVFAALSKQISYKGPQHLQEHIDMELERIKRYDVQYQLNRQNIWIVKPASRSRGRGIKAFSDLQEILDYIIGRDDIQWVAQKYIENPLIIKNRKFDIRQWVVVTDLKPLRIWMFKQCYIRFSVQQYSPDIKNRFAHLTNNSVAKHSEHFDSDQIKGYMWFQQQLAQHIKSQTGADTFWDKIKKQMETIIIQSLLSVSDMIVGRRNSLQMYGYDFMIDEDYRPYLIEVNSSPCMEYSTHVTEKLVKAGLEGIGMLVCDYMLNKKTPKSMDHYGGWRLIYNK